MPKKSHRESGVSIWKSKQNYKFNSSIVSELFYPVNVIQSSCSYAYQFLPESLHLSKSTNVYLKTINDLPSALHVLIKPFLLASPTLQWPAGQGPRQSCENNGYFSLAAKTNTENFLVTSTK